MDSIDLQVLKTINDWSNQNKKVVMGTIVQTWGSSPRPPGAIVGIEGSGKVVGSVSGGCLEDDLISKIRVDSLIDRPSFVSYGVTKEEAKMFGLPCGGILKLLLEPINDNSKIGELLKYVTEQKIVKRILDIKNHEVNYIFEKSDKKVDYNDDFLTTLHGPQWRILVIGAGQLSSYIAQFAQALDYQVIVCDPRNEYIDTWTVPNVQIKTQMPDDVINEISVDSHTAIVAVTHDPKIDDLGLIEGLKSPAFYVGALGSKITTQKRKERLLQFDISELELNKLFGPIGLNIGGKTPPEIALSLISEITAVRNKSDIINAASKSKVLMQS
jgi:xanthine dehydrogenase accessory factor